MDDHDARRHFRRLKFSAAKLKRARGSPSNLHADSEDDAQEALVRALEKEHQARERGSSFNTDEHLAYPDRRIIDIHRSTVGHRDSRYHESRIGLVQVHDVEEAELACDGGFIDLNPGDLASYLGEKDRELLTWLIEGRTLKWIGGQRGITEAAACFQVRRFRAKARRIQEGRPSSLFTTSVYNKISNALSEKERQLFEYLIQGRTQSWIANQLDTKPSAIGLRTKKLGEKIKRILRFGT